MATPGELAATLSATLGIPLGTVNYYGQSLRDAGLLSTGGRGLSAAHMTDQDAINWLVGLCAAGSARAAPVMVEATLSAKCRERSLSPEDAQTADYLFPNAKTVSDLLSALLKDAREARLQRILLDVAFRVDVPDVRVLANRHDELDGGKVLWRLSMRFLPPPQTMRRIATDEILRNADARRNTAIGGAVIQKITKCLK